MVNFCEFPSFFDLQSLFILSSGNKNCINKLLIFISKSPGLSLSPKNPIIDLGSYKFKALPIDNTFSLLSPEAIHILIPFLFKREIEYFKSGSIVSLKNIIPKKDKLISYSEAILFKCSSLFRI